MLSTQVGKLVTYFHLKSHLIENGEQFRWRMSQIRHAYTIVTATLGLFSLILIYICYYAANDVCQTVSPQGCRMSWMSPSYLLQREFNSSWTPLAHRYSLWLYREVGWESNQVRV